MPISQIISLPPRSLTCPDNLHNLTPPPAQILGHRITSLDSRQLALLQPIPLQQPSLLIRAQEYMFRYQFTMRDIHLQVLLLESFNHRREHDWYEFHYGRCYRLLGDEDSDVEVVLGNVVGERLHLFNAD